MLYSPKQTTQNLSRQRRRERLPVLLKKGLARTSSCQASRGLGLMVTSLSGPCHRLALRNRSMQGCELVEASLDVQGPESTSTILGVPCRI